MAFPLVNVVNRYKNWRWFNKIVREKSVPTVDRFLSPLIIQKDGTDHWWYHKKNNHNNNNNNPKSYFYGWLDESNGSISNLVCVFWPNKNVEIVWYVRMKPWNLFSVSLDCPDRRHCPWNVLISNIMSFGHSMYNSTWGKFCVWYSGYKNSVSDG